MAKITVNRNGIKRPPGGWRYVMQNGKRVAVANSKLNAAKAKPAAKIAAKDPLDTLVDSIISSRTAPLVDERRQLREQTAGNVVQHQRLGESYGNAVTGLRNDANLDLGAAVNKAAELRGISADTIAKNQEWLKSFVAPTHGGTGDAQIAQSTAQVAAEGNAAHDSMAREIASRGQNLNDLLAQQKLAGTAFTNERVQQERLALGSQERDIAAKIAAEKGQRADLKYQMGMAERDQRLKELVADREWDLNNRQLDASAADAAARGEEKPADKGVYGFGKERDALIGNVIAGWKAGQQPTIAKDGSEIPPVVKKPWRELYQGLRDMANLTADQAALLATRTSPQSIKGAKGGAKGVYDMLKARGVSAATQRWIIKKYFGNESWAAVVTAGHQRPANAAYGTHRPAPARPKPNTKPNANNHKVAYPPFTDPRVNFRNMSTTYA